MPRKTHVRIVVGPCCCSFNEAAARCRGKHLVEELADARVDELQ